MFSFFQNVIDFFSNIFDIISMIFETLITGIGYLISSIPVYLNFASFFPSFLAVGGLLVLFIAILHFVLDLF